VFLHGFLGTSLDWQPVCSFLPPCLCFGIDLPGHGKSSLSDEFPRFDTPIHLIGYSMGGRLAMQYAAQFPDRIASLTIASAHLGLTSEAEKQKRIAEDAAWAQLLLQLTIDEFLSRWYNQPIFGGFRPDMTMRRKQNPGLLAQCLTRHSLGKQPLFAPQNAQLIVGERDAKYRALFPDAAIIPSAAHMVHLENPRALAQIIEQRIGS
jgi:2-succinyl-6-hydroxy-2,4-cyclohexadiene-1-carboxylate synthase